VIIYLKQIKSVGSVVTAIFVGPITLVGNIKYSPIIHRYRRITLLSTHFHIILMIKN
jgi:hypothetical protein